MPMQPYNGPTYSYNPYQTYLPQVPQTTPWQTPQTYTQPQVTQTTPQPQLLGHSVTANDQIPVSEVPQNGTPAYFPMQDGSSILVKSWQPDGTISTVRYIPEVQQPIPQDQSHQDEILKRLDSMEQKLNSLTESLTN